jgi:hypothetical protein
MRAISCTVRSRGGLGPEIDPSEGLDATRRLTEDMPGQFLLGAVGTTLNL